MEIVSEIQCPWCGEAFSVAVDTTQEEQRFVTDCEVCCRPMEIVATCEPGEILGLEVLAG